MKSNLLIATLMMSVPVFAQNVGIGTSAPTGRLQINHNTSSNNPTLLLKDSAAQKSGILQFQNVNGTKYMRQTGYNLDNNNSAQSFLDVESDSAFIATFRGNGNVGINNPLPAQRLDVNGNINLTGGIITNSVPGQPGQVLVTNSAGNTEWSYGSQFPNFYSFSIPGVTGWLVPAGVTKVYIEAWGGGAAGFANFVGGGGGGGYVRVIANVTPGSAIDITIGAGGQNSGSNGGESIVYVGGSVLHAYGGLSPSITGPGTGGTFEIVSPGTTIVSQDGAFGGNPTLGYTTVISSPSTGTDNFILSYGGNGGDGGNTTNTGGIGAYASGTQSNPYLYFTQEFLRKPNTPGGGGGGSRNFNWTNGAAGKVIIHW